VAHWAETYLDALGKVPLRDHPAADPVGNHQPLSSGPP
jgi:hypothetical protein